MVSGDDHPPPPIAKQVLEARVFRESLKRALRGFAIDSLRFPQESPKEEVLRDTFESLVCRHKFVLYYEGIKSILIY